MAGPLHGRFTSAVPPRNQEVSPARSQRAGSVGAFACLAAAGGALVPILVWRQIPNSFPDSLLLLALVIPILASEALGGWLPGIVATFSASTGLWLLPIFSRPGSGNVANSLHPLSAPLLFLVGGTWIIASHRIHRQREHQFTRANASLGESENRLRQFIENLPVAVAVLDRNLCYRTASRKWIADHSLDDSKLIGRAHYDLFPDLPTEWRAIHQRALAGEVCRSESDRYVHQDGSVQWLRWEVRPIRESNQEVSGILIFSEEITARKQQEEVRERLATIVATSEDAIIAKTLDGVITSWNQGAEGLFGYPESEVLGKQMLILFPGDRRDEEASILERIRRGERVEHFETERIHRNGNRIEVSVSISPIRDSGGAIVGASSIARDITAKRRVLRLMREHEERLEAVTENLAEGLLLCDLTGRPIHWNRAAMELHRIKSPAEARSAFDLSSDHFLWTTLEGEGISIGESPLGRVLRGDVIRGLQLRIQCPTEGWESVFRYNGNVVRNAGDDPIAFLSITDVSASTAAERTRERQQRRTALLAEVSRRLVVGHSSRELVGGIFNELAEWLEVDVFLNYAAAASQDRLILEISRGLSDESQAAFAMLKFGEAVCGRVAEQRAPIVIEHLQSALRPEADRLRNLGIRAYAGFPLLASNRLVGTISFGSMRFDQFDPEDVKVMKAVGDQVAAALERDRLLAELRASNERFQNLIDQAADAMMVYDHFGRMVDCNRRACEYLGYLRSELLELDLSAFVVGFDLQKAQAKWAEIPTHGLLTITTTHRRKDGTTFPVEARIGGIQFDSRDLIIAQVRDITERSEAEAAIRESEERFRQVVENIEEVFWMTDVAKNRVLYISPGYQRIWGRSGQDLYRSLESWSDTIHPEDRERVVKKASESQASGNYNEIYRIVRPDKSVRWIQDKAYPVRDGSGVVTRIVGVAADITEQRHLEAQVRQAQKMEAIGTLAGGIAHDFNNILSAIIGFAELAQFRLGENDIVRSELNGVLEGSRRAAGLVGQILAFSRRHEPRRMPVQLCEVAAESFRLLRATLPAGIQFEVRLPPGLPHILADPNQVHQVIMNLGTNAFQSIGNRNGRITVSADAGMADPFSAVAIAGFKSGPYVHLSITDTGCGMDRGTMDRIFEPFFTTKPAGEGTGLGLSVVHGIMKSHEGTITVSSEPGLGTTFHLYFPSIEPTPKPTPGEVIPNHRGNGERILLLDDEAPLARLGQQLLESLGYQAIAHTDPAAILAELSTNPAPFHLLITDMSMPAMSGIDLALQVNQIRPHLPILLTTGFLGELQTEELTRHGIRKVLGKPFTMTSLAHTVRECLREPPADSEHGPHSPH